VSRIEKKKNTVVARDTSCKCTKSSLAFGTEVFLLSHEKLPVKEKKKMFSSQCPKYFEYCEEIFQIHGKFLTEGKKYSCGQGHFMSMHEK
jgi:hypothetical protein